MNLVLQAAPQSCSETALPRTAEMIEVFGIEVECGEWWWNTVDRVIYALDSEIRSFIDAFYGGIGSGLVDQFPEEYCKFYDSWCCNEILMWLEKEHKDLLEEVDE